MIDAKTFKMKNKTDNSSFAVAQRFIASRGFVDDSGTVLIMATDAIAFDRSERGKAGGSKTTPAKAAGSRKNLNAGRNKRWPKSFCKKNVDTSADSV